jgi:hypothetical protein
MTETPKISDAEVWLLGIERDTCQYKKERIDELLNKIGEAQGLLDAGKTASGPAASEAKKEPAAVQEITFTTLKFEPQKGIQLGDYDVAYKPNNIEDKWTCAFNILRNQTQQSRTAIMAKATSTATGFTVKTRFTARN